MYCKDFEYDGRRLSDYNGVVCHILEGGDTSAINIGSQITFNTLSMTGLNKFKLMSTQYAEAYTATFEICKFNCEDLDDNLFTEEEISHIMRWLNKKTFRKFKMIYEDGEMSNAYYNASFNVNPISYFGKVIGFQLTLQTDAPFAYYDEVEYTMEFMGDKLEQSYFDISDEIGYIYPSSMTIEFLTGGNLEIVNSQEPDRITKINNCIAGETITLIENKVITSSEEHNGLYNDFNYVYPRICNDQEYMYDEGYTVDNMENVFTVNIPCTITFKYSPICKMGIV